jgi:BirA family biotin operon repressor/biotin-[acetyl-CoA-carboxylase] ligase
LPGGFEALDAGRIRAVLRGRGCAAFTDVAVVTVTDSTNQRLLETLDARDVHGHALLAEFQTAGRGRRGDRWLSAPGTGLCLSCGWRFEAPPATFSALSLAVGLGLAASLRVLGVGAAMLKWPNDVVCGDRKLAGILIEMRAEAGGPCTVVIGIGLNLQLSRSMQAQIGQPAGDYLASGGAPLSRNVLAATLLADLAAVLARFALEGFAPLRARWLDFDALHDRRVRLEQPGRALEGIARGVDAHGALIIEHAGGRETVMSGHVRPA